MLLVFCLGLAGIGKTFGQSQSEPQQEETAVRDNLRRMRVKQQDEEGVVRIQHFINQQTTEQCTSVQQSRQRIKDIEAASGETKEEDVNITAGHGELNVTSNSGTINSDINIQIIKQGETKECL